MEFENWAFVEIGPRGEYKRVGAILAKLSEGIFLCQINANQFSHAQPIKAEDMAEWKFFPDTAEMERFLQARKELAISQQKQQQQAEGQTAAGAVGETNDSAVGLERVPADETEEGDTNADSEDLL